MSGADYNATYICRQCGKQYTILFIPGDWYKCGKCLTVMLKMNPLEELMRSGEWEAPEVEESTGVEVEPPTTHQVEYLGPSEDNDPALD